MARRTIAQRIADGYSAFRGSPAFLFIITGWFVTATLTHHFWHWDPGYANTVYYLSWEATYNGAFALMVLERIGKMREKQEAHQRQQTETILTVLEHVKRQSAAMLTLMKAIREAVE